MDHINSPVFSSKPVKLNLPFNLTTHAIPPVALTSALLLSFGQQWFDSAQSILDPRGSSHYLPFWVLKHWNQMGLVLEMMDAWCAAHVWVVNCASPLHLQFNVVQDVLMSFDTLG